MKLVRLEVIYYVQYGVRLEFDFDAETTIGGPGVACSLTEITIPGLIPDPGSAFFQLFTMIFYFSFPDTYL